MKSPTRRQALEKIRDYVAENGIDGYAVETEMDGRPLCPRGLVHAAFGSGGSIDSGYVSPFNIPPSVAGKAALKALDEAAQKLGVIENPWNDKRMPGGYAEAYAKKIGTHPVDNYDNPCSEAWEQERAERLEPSKVKGVEFVETALQLV
jgi:hypothetical protein